MQGDERLTRPGGRVVLVEGRPVRFAQSVIDPASKSKELRAVEVLELTDTDYKEREVHAEAVLSAGPDDWSRDGVHHVDPHRLDDGTWVASLDGLRLNRS